MVLNILLIILDRRAPQGSPVRFAATLRQAAGDVYRNDAADRVCRAIFH
jgi:hypothetical protein